ncbi:hypothetical protein [Rhodanobacter lindaniclasticus]|uniref:Uncharacterized protein n=1 Tax=Rhodanobacter lindaniclasticus TaxID=75310 RepID=A0A4S3KCJ3_9GAMM|nr:hypothetical protein [Rhodanobacter lindaniclasticus]THD06163.1 hypothetical protein B1991_14565 [Rhodanobacter lindaniclasticus]
MTNLLKDLEAVALLAEKATPGDWVWRRDAGKPMLINGLMFGGDGPDGQPNDAAFIIALVNLFRTHHAEIAEAVKDSARMDWLECNAINITLDGRLHRVMQIGTARDSIDTAMHNSAREDGE